MTSTVASGAATMKMMSSTSITSMNGVTLISWASPGRRVGFAARGCRPWRYSAARAQRGARPAGLVEVAADQALHAAAASATSAL